MAKKTRDDSGPQHSARHTVNCYRGRALVGNDDDDTEDSADGLREDRAEKVKGDQLPSLGTSGPDREEWAFSPQKLGRWRFYTWGRGEVQMMV